MGRVGACRVCSRADVADVDARLSAGSSLRRTAREIGMPEPTVRLHWHRCRGGKKGAAAVVVEAPLAVPPPPPEALALPPIPDGIPTGNPVLAVMERLTESHSRLWDLYVKATDDGRLRDAAVVAPELRKNQEMWLALSAKVNPDAGERLRCNPDWIATLRFLLTTLDDYPEARRAVREGLLRLKAMDEDGR